ncbi:MAG TPA: ketosamine-3-kinase [Bacteroidales bacterium]|mgnify:CR=1 FL=1|nr:ketosamine-3-kinase [Bacteroidales bacterium]
MLPESLFSEIQHTLQALAGKEALINSVTTVSGGDINRAFRVRTQYSSYFIKYNDANRYPGMFRAEAKGLDILGKPGLLRVPKVLGTSETGKYSWLLLEFIEQGRSGKNFWEDFGTSLAQLHRISSDDFGLDHNNYIGSLPQSNRQHKSWSGFFIEERLQRQLEIARNKGLVDKSLVRHFENLYKAVPGIFPSEPPSLIHGDLWSGNFMCDENGRACLIDPAVYYGFREMDIAMSRLFGGFSGSFYTAYQETYPMAPGWNDRLEICNLYPLMVHLNLFGSGYLGSVKAIAGRF